MNVSASTSSVAQLEADAVVVGVYEEGVLSGPATQIDEATGGTLRRLIQREEFRGKRYELVPLLQPPGLGAAQVLLVGLGKRDRLDRGTAFRAAGAAARQLATKQRSRVGFFLDEPWPPELTQDAVSGAVVGCQGQDIYRAEKRLYPFGEILWTQTDQHVLWKGQVIGQAVNLARRLVNQSPHELYPESFAETATEVARSVSLEVEVWDQKRLEAAGCGALLAVARGSDRPPRLVIVRHRGAAPGNPSLVLVGKGVTFDSGGLSIKPTENMKTMKGDMAGAATVLAAMEAIGKLNLPANVVGLMGLVENMPGGGAYKLGDVLTARNGKTIEVLNTDAEGRLVLADVLSVARDEGPGKIIDLATLTGACIVALGNDVAGLMTNDQAWAQSVIRASQCCGEPVWELPMFEEYGELIKSDVADIKNVGAGRAAGAISAAKFLEKFVDNTPWVHLDIAGPSFLEKPKPWLDGGGTGAFVRTLVEVARTFA